MNRYKRQGWFNESYRHYLAAKGIKTTNHFAKKAFPDFGGKSDKENIKNARIAGYAPPDSGEVKLLSKANVRYFNEVANSPGGTDEGEIREISKDMEADYIELGLSSMEAKEAVKADLRKSKEAFKDVVESSDEPDKYFASKDDMVSFTPESARRFKKQYDDAVAAGEEQFTYEGRPVLTSYATYMLEYMKMRGLVK
jgi:hypothetical protein